MTVEELFESYHKKVLDTNSDKEVAISLAAFCAGIYASMACVRRGEMQVADAEQSGPCDSVRDSTGRSR